MRRNAIAPIMAVILLIGGCNQPQQDSDMQDPDTATASMQPDFYTSDPAAEVTSPDDYTTFPAAQPVALIIESPAADAAVNQYGTHVVTKGDTLFALARRYYNDQSRWKDIYTANDDRLKNPDLLFVGQELVIP